MQGPRPGAPGAATRRRPSLLRSWLTLPAPHQTNELAHRFSVLDEDLMCLRLLPRRVHLQYLASIQFRPRSVVHVLTKRRAGHDQLIRSWLWLRKNRSIAHFLTLRFLAFGGWCLTSKSSTASRINTERGIRVRVASSFKLSSLSASRFVSIPGRVVFPIWAYISLVTIAVKGVWSKCIAPALRRSEGQNGGRDPLSSGFSLGWSEPPRGSLSSRPPLTCRGSAGSRPRTCASHRKASFRDRAACACLP